MVTLYVASSEPYSGKTLTCLVLGTRWRQQGRRVGYMKPLGLIPITVEGETTDEDAYFVAKQLELDASPSDLCPVIMTHEACRIDPDDARQRVLSAYQRISSGVDIMIVSGTGHFLTRGTMVGLNGEAVVEMLDAKALMVGRCESFREGDSILSCSKRLGNRSLGAFLNLVPTRVQEQIWDHVVPCLEASGMTIYGIMPRDPILQSVSVRELAEATQGEFLCGEEAADQLVENFVVGAMGVEFALRYFRRTPRKCVITGGDRSDIQLAALETPTRCIILTGDLQPSHTVLARAEELGVPVLLVRRDTLATISTIDNLLGKLRVREPHKIAHALEQFEAHLELAKLDRALGLD